MFNSYYGGDTSQSVKINAVTGGILKNHPKSWFERFHLQSKRAEKLLKEAGHKATKEVPASWNKEYYITTADPEHNIIVLQMMICGDMEVIAECVYERDYIMDFPTADATEGRKEEG